MSASMIGAALVLCNDRPETFGAPDVLEVRPVRSGEGTGARIRVRVRVRGWGLDQGQG